MAAQRWMQGDVRKPITVPRPPIKHRVTAKQRPTYTLCTAAFAAGALHSWSVDSKTGLWLVKITATDEWRELPQADVDSLVRGMHVQSTTHTPNRKVTPMPTKKTTAPKAKKVVNNGPMPEAVNEYVARLVYEPKRQYAETCALALFGGTTLPSNDAPWAEKVRVKLTKLFEATPVAA